MRRFIALALLLLVSLFFSATPSLAANSATSVSTPALHNGEIDLSAQYSDTQKVGKSGTLTFDAVAPFLSDYFKIGPEAKVNYASVNGGPSTTGLALGALGEINFHKGNVEPFVLLDALYWMGSLSNDLTWRASVGGGLKVGFDRVYLRGTIARVRSFGTNGNGNLDSTEFTYGVGFRL